MKPHQAALAVLIPLLLAACAAPPGGVPQQIPTLDLPPGGAGADVATDWWTTFGDAQLNGLVDEALRNNRDLAHAMARIDESRAALRLARASLYPNVDLSASAARERVSENGPTPLFGFPPIFNDYRASLNVSYEVDLWGRVANTARAAREDLLSSEYARDTLRIALAAQVVQAYAGLQSLDSQYRLFGEAVDQERESLDLQRLRFDAGDISELDIRQLEAQLITNETQLPKIDRARGEAERALALVLGRSPKDLVEQGVARADRPAFSRSTLPAGMPSDLLLHRPDVQAAEARLRAEGARVEVARAAYFPSISLTAGVGRESVELSRLTDAPSLIWNVVASLTQPIWDGGRIGAQNDAARARREQAELDYRDNVAIAFKEARDALGAYGEARVSMESGIARAQALDRAAELTRVRFQGGESSQLDVINADRLAILARAQSVDDQRALAAAQADVFRAFGGGWSAPQREASR
jgi:multidrug efflux system outer membrane protein